MIEACPNLNDPEVARVFNEIKDATSEKTAYNIWSLNNGYGIDRAPNGAPSILFQSLLSECRGDKRAAILAKAKLYGNNFRNWFGDWTLEDKTNVSKVVDKNGEPLVVYHGTLFEFEEFDFNKLGLVTGNGYYIDHITGLRIYFDSTYSFFFTDNKLSGKSYKNLAIDQLNKLRAQFYKNLASIFLQNKYLASTYEQDDNFKKQQAEFIDNVLSPVIGFDVRREANAIIEGNSNLSKDKINELGNKFKQMYFKILDLPDARSITNTESYLDNAKLDLLFLKEHKNELLSNKKLPYFDKKIKTISTGYGNWEKGDVHATIGYDTDTNEYYVVGIPDESGIIKPGKKKLTHHNFDLIINQWEKGILNIEKGLEDKKNAGKYNSKGNVMPVFLSIKNPLVHDYNGSPFPDNYLIDANENDKNAGYYGESDKLKKPLEIDNKRVPTAYIAARLVKKAQHDGNDGVVYNNVRDPLLMNSYGIFNPNQVKSVFNDGGYSNQNNSIYHHISGSSIAQEIFLAIQYELELSIYDFCERMGFKLLHDSDADTVVDFVHKVINIQEFTVEEFNKVKARVAAVLMPVDLKEKISDVADKYDKSIDDIADDILDVLNNKPSWLLKEKSLLDKILSFISGLIDRILQNQEYYETLISRAAHLIADENSDYYRTVIKEGFEQKGLDIEKLKESPLYNVYKILTKLGASLDGSAAVRMQGTLYRAGEEDFHDLDFTKPYDDFSWDVYNELQFFFNNYKTATNNFMYLDSRVYKDLRNQMLENVNILFKVSKIYKELSKYYSDIKIKHAAKTKQLGLFVTITVDDFPVDIFYAKNVDHHVISGIKVTDFSVAFAAKLVMGREKDIRDIINFHQFDLPAQYETGVYTVYQGRKNKNSDNRKYNYYTLSKNEAEAYGPNLRKTEIDTSGFLNKFDASTSQLSEEYKELLKEFNSSLEDGELFDLFDNSKRGMQIQNQFWEFLKQHDYKGFVAFPQNKQYFENNEKEDAYIITFDNYEYSHKENSTFIREFLNRADKILKTVSRENLFSVLRKLNTESGYLFGRRYNKKGEVKAMFPIASTGYGLRQTPTIDLFKSFLDLETPISREEFDDLWNLLTSKLNNKVELIEESTLDPGNAYSEVVDGVVKVHIPAYREGISYTTLAEELLHPIVHTILFQNRKLFEDFLNLCLNSKDQTIKLIRSTIENLYKDKPEHVIENEIVTQTLAYLLKNAKESDSSSLTKKSSIFKKFVDAICILLNKLGLIGISPNTFSLEHFAYALKFRNLKLDVIDTYGQYDHIVTNSEYDDAAIKALSSMPEIQIQMDEARENYIRNYISENGPITDDERDNLAKEFDLDEMRRNTYRIMDLIAAEYNISKDENDDYIGHDKKSKYIVMLLNNMYKRLSDPKFAPVEAQFLLNTLINTNDVSTIIMLMARVYIEDFYEADAIQTIMEIIDPSGEMHKDDLIDALTDIITKAVLNPKSTEYSIAKRINNTITNFLRKTFNQDTISEQAKLILADVIAKNMSCCEDIYRTDTDDLLHDVKWYKITGKESQVTCENIVNAIKKGITVRIRSLSSSTNIDEAKILILNQMLAKLDDIDIENNPDDVLGVISDFINEGMQEISNANHDLRLMLNIDPSQIDDSKLYRIRTDIVGYYKSIINNYILPFTRNATNPTILPGGALYAVITKILDDCDRTQRLYDYVLRVHTNAIVDKWVDYNVDIGDKKRFALNCKLWLANKINNGDLGFFENWIKSAVSSHSLIVRMIDDFVRDVNTKVHLAANRKGRHLTNLYEKCESFLSKILPFNYLRNFCELDDDGNTTGNFVTKVNVGQFKKEEKRFIDRWIEKRGIVRQDDGTLEFPDEETWKDFNDAYDDFLSTRKHRRYKAEYYKLEREFMSRDTIEYKRNIRKRILLLYEKCYDKEIGAPNLYDLTYEDQMNLMDLLKIQQNLSNPYIITYDSRGKIESIEEKKGDQLRMAMEITAFNHALGGRISFTPNYSKYLEAKEKIKDKYGEDSNQYKMFVYNFSTREVSPVYYAKLKRILGDRASEYMSLLDDINHRIKAIINATISKRGKYVLDLSKMSDAAYAELKRLEELKEDLASKFTGGGGRRLTEEEVAELNSMHHFEYVVNPETGIPVIKELELEYESRGKTREFLDKFFVQGEDGLRPLSVFVYDSINSKYIDEESPIGIFSDVDSSSEFIDPLYDPEDNEFMNIDKTRYYNPKYDEIMSNRKMRIFYKSLLRTMELGWRLLPTEFRHYKYQLPQRRGCVSQLVARDVINTFTGREGGKKSSIGSIIKNTSKLVVAGAIGGLILGGLASLSPMITASSALIAGLTYGSATGLVYGLLTRDKNISDLLLSITENDTEFNESFSIRPDGSEVETVPIRFVRRLDDPTSVDTDLIASVTSFYEMALNYSQKEKLAPIVENILFDLSGGFNGRSVKEQADRVRTYKSSMIYGRRKTGLSGQSSNKMTKSEQKISKLVSFMLNTTHAKMLPWNGTSIFKNMIDSAFSAISLICAGKHFVLQDLAVALRNMGKEIFDCTAFSNIGKPGTKSFTGAALQHHGCHQSIRDTFKDTHKYWLRRIIERFLSMCPFTLIDYTFKGLFINMTYNTYRLVKDPSTGTIRFMNKQEAQFAYANYGGRKKGLKIWKNAKKTLRDAYEISDFGLLLKPEYENIVRPKIDGISSYKVEKRVSGLVKEQTSVVNGMLDDMDINKISTNFIGSMILTMRGWMVSQLIDYNKDGQDFAVFASSTEEINKALLNKNKSSLLNKFTGSLESYVIHKAPRNFEGQYNSATGFMERGWWVGWTKIVKNLLKYKGLVQHNVYQLKYLVMILATTIGLGLSTYPLYKWRLSADEKYKDTDPYNTERVASNFLYTSTVAAYSERFGQLGPFGFSNSMMELVNSPTVAASYVKDLNSVIDLSEDIFVLFNAMLEGQDILETEPMQIVKRGNFNKRKKITKDALKTASELPEINKLGITNIYKTLSPDAEKEKLKFYVKTIPMKKFQPWLKLPEKNQSSQSKSSTNKKQKVSWN